MEIETKQEEKQIYQLFKWSILIKGAISVAEVIVGTLVMFIPVSVIMWMANYIVENIFAGNTENFFAAEIISNAEALAGIGTLIIGAYLIARGGIKLGLIIGLLKNKLWAYPWSLIVIGLLVVFQVFELIKTLHLGIIFVTIFDLVVMYLIWREWNIVKRHLAAKE
jgi:uncharacterized membrane protein